MDVVTHLPPQLPSLSGTIPFFLELSSISNFQKQKHNTVGPTFSLFVCLLSLSSFLV